MPGMNLTLANNVLKDVYGDINEQINQETPALDGIKSTAKNIDKTGGAGIRFVAHVGRNVGMGARLEDEDLPEAGRQQYVDGRTGLKSLYGAVRLTGQIMSQASQNYQAFADVAGEEVERIRNDLAKDQNRQVYGDGNGTLATLTAASTGTTLTVDDVKYFRTWKGRIIDVLAVNTLTNTVPTPRNTYSIKVVSVNRNNSTITVDVAVAGAAVGDKIVIADRSASGGSNSWGKEWTGLSAMVSDTRPVFGIDPAVEPEWQSIVRDISSGGTPGTLTEEDLIDMSTDIREGGEYPTVMLTTHKVLKAYWRDLEGKRTYVNKVALEGGMSSVSFESEFGAIPFKADYDAPKGQVFFLNQGKINLNTNKGWEWIDEDGSKWKQVPRRDAFVAYLRSYSELSTYRRNTHGLLKGIAE